MRDHLEGKFVKFPPYSTECYNDASVGMNPDAAYDCGKPTGPIWKVGWKGVAEKWPGAAAAIGKFDISNDDMGALVSAVDLDGVSIDAAVAGWLGANKATWSNWIK